MSYSVLVVDDEDNAREFVGALLEKKGYEVIQAATLGEAREKVKKGIGDVVLLDLQLKGEYGLNLLYETNSMPMRPPIIVITGFGDIETAVDAVPGIRDISLTTNAMLLEGVAGDLAAAGLKRINVSLDTLQPERFARITRGGSLERVMRGIRAAEQAGMTPIKVNAVMMRGSMKMSWRIWRA